MPVAGLAAAVQRAAAAAAGTLTVTE